MCRGGEFSHRLLRGRICEVSGEDRGWDTFHTLTDAEGRTLEGIAGAMRSILRNLSTS